MAVRVLLERCTAETEGGVLGGRLTAAVADGETPYGPGAEVTTARNVRSRRKRLARRCRPHRPNRGRAGYKAVRSAGNH
jgi:hypothetical protein